MMKNTQKSMSLLFLFVLLFSSLVNASFREPWVEKIHSFFSPQDCLSIVSAAEEHGFPSSADSIDYDDKNSTVSWAIDVETMKKIQAPSIASLYAKYLPKLEEIVIDRQKILQKTNNPDSTGNITIVQPSLDWVFLRKYQAGEKRRMLKLHQDVNLFTFNVALNDNYKGGGLFYQKNLDSYYEDDNPVPEMPDEKRTYTYLEGIKRQNTTERVFPSLQTGDMLLHNYSLYHGIGEILEGTRYSLVFFYNMKHPHVVLFNVRPIKAIIYNEVFDFPIDLYLIDPKAAEYTRHLVQENLGPKTILDTKTEHVYEVLNRETGQVVDWFDVFDPLEDQNHQEGEQSQEGTGVGKNDTSTIEIYLGEWDEDEDEDEEEQEEYDGDERKLEQDDEDFYDLEEDEEDRDYYDEYDEYDEEDYEEEYDEYDEYDEYEGHEYADEENEDTLSEGQSTDWSEEEL